MGAVKPQKHTMKKTTIELPDDLMKRVKLRALRDGKKLKDAVADLLKAGLSTPPPAPRKGKLGKPIFDTDPETGAPVIRCDPNAPISKMSGEEMHELIRKIDEEEDLERFTRSLRR